MPPKPKLNPRNFPRPPALEKTSQRLQIIWHGTTVVDTTDAYRVLETWHPPTYYIPPSALLHTPSIKRRASPSRQTLCEWKGRATYWILRDEKTGEEVRDKVWSYEEPTRAFAGIAGFLSFYAAGVPWECWVDGEKVEAQPGDFYGGWMTSEIEGQVKGGPGTWGCNPPLLDPTALSKHQSSETRRMFAYTLMATWSSVLCTFRSRRRDEALEMGEALPSQPAISSPPSSLAVFHPATTSASPQTADDSLLTSKPIFPFMRLPTEIRQQILLFAAGECKLDHIDTARIRHVEPKYAIKRMSDDHRRIWRKFRYLCQINRRIRAEMKWVQKKWLDIGMRLDEFSDFVRRPKKLSRRPRAGGQKYPDMVIDLTRGSLPLMPSELQPNLPLSLSEKRRLQSRSDLWLEAMFRSRKLWQLSSLRPMKVPRVEIRATGLSPIFKSHYELLARGLIEIGEMVSHGQLRYKVMWEDKILLQSQVAGEQEALLQGGNVDSSASVDREREVCEDEWMKNYYRYSEILDSQAQEFARLESRRLRSESTCEVLDTGVASTDVIKTAVKTVDIGGTAFDWTINGLYHLLTACCQLGLSVMANPTGDSR